MLFEMTKATSGGCGLSRMSSGGISLVMVPSSVTINSSLSLSIVGIFNKSPSSGTNPGWF
jgi:hypothetical protein